MHEGTIENIVEPRGFGFVSAPNQPDCFFHFRDLADELDFDELLVGRRVRFEIIEGDKGPRAANVRPAD